MDPMDNNEFKNHILFDNADIETAEILSNDNFNSSSQTVGIFLSSFGPEIASLAPKFAERCILFSDLSSLSDNDLKLLGVKSEPIRRQMLEEISYMPTYSDNFDKMIKNTNPNDYNNSVLNRVSNHLTDLKTSLIAAQLKLFISPPEDILIGDKIFSAQLVFNSLREITKNIDIMEAQLIELKEGKVNATTETRKKIHKIINYTLLISGLSITGYLFFKFFKIKTK